MSHKVSSSSDSPIFHQPKPKKPKKISTASITASQSPSSKSLKSKKFSILKPNTSLNKLAPFSTNFFEKIGNAFATVVRWMLRKPTPLAVKGMELAFAMELYRSSDDVLVELSKGGAKTPEAIPYSGLLNLWTKFLKNSKNKIDANSPVDQNEIKSIAKQLSKSASIQKKIEKIDLLPEEKQLKAYKNLYKNTLKTAKHLEDGEKCYIPGAIRDESGTHYVMYEIEKDITSYKFRAFGVLEDKNSPLETTSSFADDEELEEGLTFMLGSAIDWKGVQGLARLTELGDKLNKLGYTSLNAKVIWTAFRKSPIKTFKTINNFIGIKTIFKMGITSIYKFATSKQYRSNFDLSTFLDDQFTILKKQNVKFYEKEDLESHLDTENLRQQESSSEKTIEVFFKGMKPKKLGRTLKITLKASLLEDIFYKSRNQLHKYPDLRRELQHEMENLYASIEKNKNKLALAPQKQLMQDLLEELSTIDDKDRLLPSAPNKQKGVRSSFNDLIRLPQSTTPINTFKTVNPHLRASATKEPFPDLAFDTPDEIAESFIHAQEYCQVLITNKDYLNLDAALTDIIEKIKEVDLTTLDDAQLGTAKEALSFFALALAHSHFALKREEISASLYYQLATIAKLYDSDFFENPASKNHDYFSHPYMDLGIYSTKSFKKTCNNVFNSISSLDFTNLSEFKANSILEFDFDWLEAHSDDDQEERGKQCIAMCIAALVAGEPNPKKNGPIIKDDEITSRIIEGIITDDGNSPGDFAIPKADNTGIHTVNLKYSSTQTAHSILEEKHCFKGLPMDVSAELQLMQTSPETNTRIKYAMGAFSKIAGIFGDGKIGLNWQRVFSITLTQDAALDRLLTEEPEYALVYLDVLRGMIEDVQASGNISAALFLMRMHRESLPILEDLQKRIEAGKINVSDDVAVQFASRLDAVHEHCDLDFEQITIWKEKTESEASRVSKKGKVTNVLRNRSLIHQQFLYHLSLSSQLSDDHPVYQKLDDEALRQIFISTFIIEQTSTPAHSVPLDVERTINLLKFKTSPEINKFLQESDLNDLQDWLVPLLPPEGQDKEFDDAKYPLFTANEYTIDIEKKVLYIDGKAKRMIPASIAADKNCEKVFGEAGLFALRSSYKNISYKENGIEQYAEQYIFKFKGEHYSIVAKDSDEILIYKRCQPPGQKKEAWFLYQNIDFLSSENWDADQAEALGLDKDAPKPPRQYLPKELRGNNLWIHPKARFVYSEGKDDQESYYISISKHLPKQWRSQEIDSGRLCKATKVRPASSKKIQVLNPWTLTDFKIFQTLDTHENILASGEKGRVSDIVYKRVNLSYKWDRAKKSWRCLQYPGYQLSPKKIKSFLKVANAKKSAALFTSNFNDYQIIEHPTKLPKLLLSGCECYRGSDNNIHKKYTNFESESSLFSYDIDPQVGIKCQNASGYFYLAYTLLTQKRYTEGLAYLRKAHSLDIQKTDEFEKIVAWIRNWEDDSYEGLAFKLHFEHQMFEWMRIHNPKGFATQEVQERIEQIGDQLESYLKIKDSISSSLHLTKNQTNALTLANEFDLLETQENVVAFITAHPEFDGVISQLQGKGGALSAKDLFEQLEELKEAVKDELFSFEELQALAEAGLTEIKGSNVQRLADLISLEKSKGLRLKKILESDIKLMEAKIKKNKPPKSKKKVRTRNLPTTPIFSKDFLNTIIEDTPAKVGNIKDKLKKFKEPFFKDDDNEYLMEKGEQLTADIKIAVKNLDTLRALKKNLDIDALVTQLQSGDDSLSLEGYDLLRKSAAKHKAAILQLFQITTIKPNSNWEAVKLLLEQREETLTSIFNTARFCYASNDFSDLVKEGIIKKKDIKALKKHMKAFLEKDSMRQQYFRALEKAKQIKAGGDIEILGPQLIQILDQKRAYDSKKDKDSPMLAVFEWECGYVATVAQITNFKDMLSESNLFKLEALAGGKTTVIRNLIAKYKADGYHLSGVITHVPLMEMHHPLFEKAAREAYGEKVLTFNFSRKTPTDEVSLTQILYNLNLMIVEKGRIDLSKRDLLSLHHAFILKCDQLAKPAIEHGLKPDAAKPAEDLTIQKELDVFSQVISLIKNHLQLGSDEFDTISNCNEEHIFAYGGKMPLNPHKVKGALKIMEWILNDPSLKSERKAFRKNLQCKFSEKEYTDFINKIALLAHRDLAPDLDMYQLVDYLTEPLEEGESPDFFNDEIMPHAAATELKVLKKYLQDIMTQSTLGKQGGVKYGRSEDGWLVKPYESSDVCMENSQQSSEEETIWYTLCNYLDRTLGGVKADQIGELVQTKQAEAAKEIKNARKLDKLISFKDTKAAKAWDKDFDIPLIEVVPEQYKKIAKEINNDPKLLERFLLHYVFPKNYSSKKKIGANAHDLAEMVLEFYGSAGTSEVAPTFPSKIKLIDDLVSQEGVNGRVLWSLIKTFQDGDIIYSDNVIDTLAEEMKEGDTLIDLAPAFPGISGKAIAKKVGDKLKEKGKIDQDSVLRFIDTANEPRLLDPETGIESAMPSNLNIKKTTNILGQKDSRGTNFEMADDSIGYLTIGPSTTSTDFMQAALRMRKLPERLLSDSDKGQRLRYILDPTMKAVLGDNPTLEELEAFLSRNEIDKLKESIRKSEMQRIEALPRTTAYIEFSRIEDYEARRIIWPLVKDLFIQDSQVSVDNGGLPNQKQAPLEILKGNAGKKREKIANLIAFLEAIKSDDKSGLSPETEAAIDVFIESFHFVSKELKAKEHGKNLPKAKYLPKDGSTTATELDMHQTTEQEQELEVETQLQLQQTTVAIGGMPVTSPRPDLGLKHDNPTSLCDKLYHVNPTAKRVDPTGLYQSLKRSVPYMDDYTYYTRGAYPNFMNGQDPWQQFDPAKAGQIQIPRFFIMVDKRFDPPRVVSIVGTENDFDEIDTFAKTHKGNREVDLYVANIRNDKLDGGLFEWSEDYSEEVKEAISQRLIQIKFLNGEIDLLKPNKGEKSPIRQEYKAFKKWLNQMIDDGLADAAELERIYLQYLQAYRPSQVPQYHTSAVAEVFLKLKAKTA